MKIQCFNMARYQKIVDWFFVRIKTVIHIIHHIVQTAVIHLICKTELAKIKKVKGHILF